jgi:hypothetical protein
MTNVVDFPKQEIPDMKGPERTGYSVIIDNRKIPKLHMYDRGDSVEFILDGRLAFEFPSDLAYHAATFAANAMAIGAGFAFLGAETKERPFAPQCFGISLDADEQPPQ